MIPRHPEKVGDNDEPELPRRDWFLLPLLSLLTVILILFSMEWVARKVFFSPTLAFNCLVTNDSSTGVRAIPNSACSVKLPESTLTKIDFNNCGHRAGMDCAPKAQGTYRIVLVGSSYAEGLYVPWEQTFAASVPAQLTKETGRKIELYNEGMHWGTPRSVDLQFKQVLAAKPDMILWTLTPWDIQYVKLLLPVSGPQKGGVAGEGGRRADWQRFKDAIVQKPRTLLFLQHYLYQSPTYYVTHYLIAGDGADFLKSETNPVWQRRLQELDVYAADMEAQTKSAGIPLVAVLIPQRAQAAMISMGEWPNGFNPYKLGDQVRAIIEGHGGIYLDILQDFRNLPNAEQYYFPVDGHLNPAGHAMASRLLVKALIRGVVPALTVTGRALAASSGRN